MNPDKRSAAPRAIAIIAVIIVGAGALIYSLIGKKVVVPTTVTDASAPAAQTTAPASTDAVQVSAATPVTSSGTSSSTYKDGTYSATGSYLSPGGTEQLGVSITLKNDIVTAVTITPKPVDPEGNQYQKDFAQNLDSFVIGKEINTIHLTTVSRSSLTSGGFNQALAAIEAQASAA